MTDFPSMTDFPEGARGDFSSWEKAARLCSFDQTRIS
jgi:hypothetical protein